MGLAQGNVTSITRDYEGFLWIATEDGLCKYNGYSFTTYRHNPKDSFSLTNNMIFNVREDYKKRLWVTTRYGFHLYDRLNDRFIHYKFEGEGAFLNNQLISDCYFDSDSTAWIASLFGLVKYNFSNHKIENRLSDFRDVHLIKGIDIHVLRVDHHSNIWVMGNKGCFKVDFKQKRVIELIFKGTHGETFQTGCTDFYEDINGNHWIATTGQGVFIFNQNNQIIRRLNTKDGNLSNNDLTFIRTDIDHNIWIGTNIGLNIITAKQILNQDYNCLNLKHKFYDRYSILSDIITAFYEDKEGRIWIGSRFGGVDYYDKQIKKFNHLFLQPGSSKSLSHNNITSIVENKKGEIFIGTDGGGIDILSKDKRTVTPFSKYIKFGKLTCNKVLALSFDLKDRLFVGMWDGGIDIFDFRLKKQIHLKKGNGPLDLSSNSIFCLLTDKKGNTWIGTSQEGVNRIDPLLSHVIHFPKSGSDLYLNSGLSILQLYEDKSGDIWMAADPSGVNRFDYRTGKMSYFFRRSVTQKENSTFNALSFFEDSKGQFWIGTRGDGIRNYDRKKNKFNPKLFNSDTIDGDVYGIQEDEKGFLWISSNNGLSKLEVSKIGDAISYKVKNFDVDDGLQADQYNLWASFKSNDGYLFFGGVNGLNYFKPGEIVFNEHKPNVVFTGFSLFNKEMKPGMKESPLKCNISECKEIILNYEQSLFSIEFVAMNFTQPKNNEYRCKLDGFEENWRNLGSERKVTYTNLDPGRYVFRVLASNNDGLWSNKESTLTIVILPPWWKTLWFRLLVIVSFVLLVSFIWRYRIKKLEETNEDLEKRVTLRTLEISEQSKELETVNNQLTVSNNTKDRLFSIIAHDLRGPFNGIIGISNYLKESYDEFTDSERKEMISTIEKSSNNLYNLLSNLLHWSMSQQGTLMYAPEKIHLAEIINQAVNVVKGNIEEKHILLELDIPDIIMMADSNQLQAIIRNLLSNAIKYSQDGGLISIFCKEVENDQVKIEVQDHGIGMPADVKERLFKTNEVKSQLGTKNEQGTGLGLMIVRDFVEIDGGTVDVYSTIGNGTTFIIHLPIHSKELEDV
jgi:signal transduction histidine kinase/ligand-binding sensor domain-containing protein